MEQILPKTENIIDISFILKISQKTRIVSLGAQWFLYLCALILSDTIMTALALRFAFWLRFEVSLGIFYQNETIAVDNYLLLIYSMPFIWLSIFAINGLYAKDSLLSGTQEYEKVFRSASEGFLLIVVAGFLGPNLVISRGWILMTWCFSFLFVAISRLFLRRIIYLLREQGFFMASTIIVGANEEGKWVAEQLRERDKSGLYIVGFIDNEIPVSTSVAYGLVSLGTIEQLDEIINRYDISEVILTAVPKSTNDYYFDVYKKYRSVSTVNIRLTAGLYQIITNGLTFNDISYISLGHINKAPLSGADNAVKFIFDYILAFTILLLCLPLIILIASMIKISSQGPILYKKLAIGLNGNSYSLWKFRTTTPDNEQNWFLGFLEKHKLDEFPQLINVLLRDMSLVGPLPISPDEEHIYKQFGVSPLMVLPGITGIVQIGTRADITPIERARAETYYVRNWSIWLDLQLLFQTIPIIVSGSKSKQVEPTSKEKTAAGSKYRLPKIKVSVSFPKFLSKRYASHFKVRIYPDKLRDKVKIALAVDEKKSELKEQEFDSELLPGSKIELKLHSPVVDFSDPVREIVSWNIQTVTFTGIPKDNCYPGNHAVVLTIIDPDTNIQYSDIPFNVDIRDFAFDHVSRPFLSNISTTLFGIGSVVAFGLTLLGQVDQAFGVASGTTAAIIAGYLQLRSFALYRNQSNKITNP